MAMANGSIQSMYSKAESGQPCLMLRETTKRELIKPFTITVLDISFYSKATQLTKLSLNPNALKTLNKYACDTRSKALAWSLIRDDRRFYVVLVSVVNHVSEQIRGGSKGGGHGAMVPPQTMDEKLKLSCRAYMLVLQLPLMTINSS